jgi:hypothetical protein
MVGVAVFTIKQTGFGAQDQKAANRHQRREARYSTPAYNYWRATAIKLSQLHDGTTKVVSRSLTNISEPNLNT